ncbi:MAG: hypothetical protein ACSLFM_08985 [Tepidiformaceae bacterium]
MSAGSAFRNSPSPAAPESRTSGFAVALTRAWVALYTRGTDPEAALRRRSEIESDLWEQREEARATGRHPLRHATDVSGRLVRGMPADIAWRSNMEGPLMSFSIPANRGAGILFLITIVLLFIATSIPGYDAGADGWDSEMRRIDDLSTTATSVNTVVQVLTGLALVLAAGAFGHFFRQHHPLLASVASFSLAAAGILTFATSASYGVMVEYSREWVDDPASGASAATTARAFAIIMTALGYSAMLCLLTGVATMSVIVTRADLAPAWTKWLAIGAVTAVVAGLGASALTNDGADTFAWISVMSGLLLSVTWLLVTGIALIARDSKPAPPVAPAAA